MNIQDAIRLGVCCIPTSSHDVMEAWSDEAREASAEARKAGAALKWIADQESWRGHVDVVPGETHIRELVPNPTSQITASTVRKYEQQILREVKHSGALERPFVVSRSEGGKPFLQDGNHYYQAARNLRLRGLLPSSAVEHVKILEVVPRSGYKFGLDPVAARFGLFSQTLLPSK